MMEFVTKEPITAGWSHDIKYKAVGTDGNTYFLRVYPDGDFERHKQEFDLMHTVESYGVPMARALELGEEHGLPYIVTEWIDGDIAETVIPKMPKEKAYEYGVKAGEYLKLIHRIPAPINCGPWKDRFSRQLDNRLDLYASCKYKYEHGALFYAYCIDNRELFSDRPQCMHHGDYHVGNMMIDRSGELKIIDFNRFDHGDPFKEFNRIAWSAQCSSDFATGLVDGYFGGKVPEEFWKLLLLYLSSNILGSLPWAVPYGEEEVKTMRRQAADILEWYAFFYRNVPSWYRKNY